MRIAYSGATSRLPEAADVARAVETALVDAKFKVGDGMTTVEPVKSVAGVDKEASGAGGAGGAGGVGAGVGRRLSESDQSGTFTITVIAFASELQPISKAVRTPDFGDKVAQFLRDAGARDISDTTATFSPVTVVGGDVVGPNTLEKKPRTEAGGGDLAKTDEPVGGDLAKTEGADQSVADDAVPGWGVFLLILLLLCCLSPLFCYLYVHFKYGAGKEANWFKYIVSHSNPTLPFLYIPREDREALRVALYEEKKPAATLEESATEDNEVISQSRV